MLNRKKDNTPPSATRATIEAGELSISFDEIINRTRLSRKRFRVTADRQALQIKSASVPAKRGSIVSLSLDPTSIDDLSEDSAIRVSYTDPNNNQIKGVVQDLFGNDLESFNNLQAEFI